MDLQKLAANTHVIRSYGIRLAFRRLPCVAACVWRIARRSVAYRLRTAAGGYEVRQRRLINKHQRPRPIGCLFGCLFVLIDNYIVRENRFFV